MKKISLLLSFLISCVTLVNGQASLSTLKGMHARSTLIPGHIDIELDDFKPVISAQNIEASSATEILLFDDLNSFSGIFKLNSTNNFLGPGTAQSMGILNFSDHHLILGTNNLERMRITNTGNVGVGTTSPSERFTSEVTSSESIGNAIYGLNTSALNSETNGILGLSNGASSGQNIGVNGRANGSMANQIGVYGWSFGSEDLPRFGTVGLANGTGATAAQIGIYGWILGSSAATRYAIFGEPAGTGTGTQYAGYFNGDVTVVGTFSNPSDAKFKRNIRSMNSQLDKIRVLNPVTYEMKTEEFSQMNFDKGTQVGFIAQEVESVFPSLIKENIQVSLQKPAVKTNSRKSTEIVAPAPTGEEISYKGINSISMIPILTKGIQELADLLEARDKEVVQLREDLNQQAQEMITLKLALDQLKEKLK